MLANHIYACAYTLSVANVSLQSRCTEKVGPEWRKQLAHSRGPFVNCTAEKLSCHNIAMAHCNRNVGKDKERAEPACDTVFPFVLIS